MALQRTCRKRRASERCRSAQLRIINAGRVACCASCEHCGGHPKCKAETDPEKGETGFVVPSVVVFFAQRSQLP